MSGNKKSKKHHWWPVGLQSYWADRQGNVSWIDPNGKVTKKRAVNRNIGFKQHGHTFFRGSVWETNFENEFDIDDRVHEINQALKDLEPFGRTPSEFFAMIKLLFKKNRKLKEMCKFYYLDERLHRNLLLLIHSILIRSPANRARYEDYPKLFGMPPDEEVGKANMLQNYQIAKRLCSNGLISNHYFVILHSPLKKFIFGDGCLDWLTSGLVNFRINGRTLVPFSPHICIYFCTPTTIRSAPNCASISAPPWMVDWVNEITQVYSKDKLFFLGKAPKLTDAFQENQFLRHKNKSDALIDMLDEITNIKTESSLTNLRSLGVR